MNISANYNPKHCTISFEPLGEGRKKGKLPHNYTIRLGKDKTALLDGTATVREIAHTGKMVTEITRMDTGMLWRGWLNGQTINSSRHCEERRVT